MHLGDAFISVLGTTILGSRRISRFQVGNEVRYARCCQRAAQPRAVHLGDGVGHVAAVAHAVYHDSDLVERRLRLNPVEKRADVLYRILPPHPVIEPTEGFSKTPASPNTRKYQRDPKLVQKIRASSLISRTFARSRSTRAAVDRNDDRPWSGESHRRAVQDSGDRHPVEAFPPDDFRFGQRVGIERAKFALRPTFDGTGTSIHAKDITERSK